MPKYANDQPVGFQNTIERVAIVGAGGTIGTHIVSALLKAGKHTVTALSRKDSSNKLPEGVLVAPVDYNDEATLVAALQGQQFLIITMAPTAPRDTHSKLVQAAAKAGIPYVMPNWYGGDIDNIKLGEDTLLGPMGRANREEIERLGMQWITVCCGFWYDYSLAGGDSRFGFDLVKRSLTLYDDGNSKISTSTLAQVGRAVAKVLSLPVLPQDADDTSLTLSTFFNRSVYVKSFVVSQADMLASVKRVTGTTDADWTITRQDTKTRYEEGLAQVKSGNMAGFSKLLYSRVFYPDETRDLSTKVQNELLELPVESLDEATKAGIELDKELQLRTERMAA
ncbi:aromatic alcohol reductase [Aspergillus homomorphus CBS 101889]|uniref:Putative isoflavone reductase family protein n=1 Tax=Aspergillus homomorphus (strain CBS 101889) TaxID=1450537 RepID=A0A395IAC7_ASPHC|nr:putative isoflavone reductase family protein [Aspergillus homomorphus CBS 101889]RAL16163.1 putative isoflavone reductase family protein [Aspergillus homomorphus CBS 101889]